MNSNLLIFVLLVVVSALALAASASESAVTLYSCSYSSSCRYASRCLGRYATAGRSYYFSEPVGCCMCLDPYSCYGCRNFGECSLLKSYCTAFGSYPSGISNTGKMPTWARTDYAFSAFHHRELNSFPAISNKTDLFLPIVVLAIVVPLVGTFKRLL